MFPFFLFPLNSTLPLQIFEQSYACYRPLATRLSLSRPLLFRYQKVSQFGIAIRLLRRSFGSYSGSLLKRLLHVTCAKIQFSFTTLRYSRSPRTQIYAVHCANNSIAVTIRIMIRTLKTVSCALYIELIDFIDIYPSQVFIVCDISIMSIFIHRNFSPYAIYRACSRVS